MFASSLLSVFALLLSPCKSCTEFILRSQHGSSTVGRTMDFSTPFYSVFSSEGRGENRQSYLNNIPNHCPYEGAWWTSLYKVLLVRPVEEEYQYAAVDGINEFGLTASALYLRGTQYEDVCDDRCQEAIPQGQFIEYVLSRYRTVDELLNSMNEGTFPCVVGNIDKGIVHPIHFGVTDAEGVGVVVEYVEGRRIVHNNTLGVLTNAPNYDWHMANVRKVFHFKDNNTAPSYKYEEAEIPGDDTSEGHFLKTTRLLHFSVPPNSKEDAILTALHILESVSVVKFETERGLHFTYWVLVKDLGTRCIYYKTYQYISVRMVCIDDVPADTFLPLDHKEENFKSSVENMSSKMEAHKYKDEL